MDSHLEPKRDLNVLLVIVAYEAERHLPELIERLSSIQSVNDHWSILLLDDASHDRTREIAQELFRKYDFPKWLVARNEENQGYGGNQKVGYQYALCSGEYTHVALLHGDCQYPPEALPDMLDEATRTGADVVLGTRMWSVKSAWRGRMPAYKIVGNKVLTRLQNRLTHQKLTEYHTGLRLFSTKFLRRIPYELNSDGFDFDTEILLQAFYVNARVVEIQIPTRYADEVCHVPGLRYAWSVTRASLDYWLQKHGMGCSLRFRDLKSKYGLYLDKTQIKGSTHDLVLDLLLKEKPASVLDIGCGAGYIGAALKKHLPEVRYAGSDLNSHAPEVCDEYWQCDLNRQIPPVNPYDYDVVLCLDVLEHLTEPEQFLLRLRQSHPANKKTRFIFSTANVAFISIRFGLLLGRFEYGDRGILDIDHRRLMTRRSFVRLIRESGFSVQKVINIPVPLQLVFGDKRWTRLATAIWRPWMKILPGLFAFQILAVAGSKPPIPDISLKGEENRMRAAMPVTDSEASAAIRE